MYRPDQLADQKLVTCEDESIENRSGWQEHITRPDKMH